MCIRDRGESTLTDAVAPTTNPFSSARTKPIDVRFHFIRELVRSKTISVCYVPTKKQRAEILTKAFVVLVVFTPTGLRGAIFAGGAAPHAT